MAEIDSKTEQMYRALTPDELREMRRSFVTDLARGANADFAKGRIELIDRLLSETLAESAMSDVSRALEMMEQAITSWPGDGSKSIPELCAAAAVAHAAEQTAALQERLREMNTTLVESTALLEDGKTDEAEKMLRHQLRRFLAATKRQG